MTDDKYIEKFWEAILKELNIFVIERGKGENVKALLNRIYDDGFKDGHAEGLEEGKENRD